MMQEESQDNKNPTQRVQNSNLLLSPISSNCQLAGKKIETYMITQLKTRLRASGKILLVLPFLPA